MKIQFNPTYNCINKSMIPASFLASTLSFCQFRKVGQAKITDKETGKEISAIIKKENMLDEYISYQMYVKKNLVGYIDITIHPNRPKGAGKDSSIPYETIPEISHLRTIEGERYAKIGSTLVGLAIEESKKHSANGSVWLKAEKGYKKAESPYRSNENPIPFYYKLGFSAVDKSDENIRNLIKKGEIQNLPDEALLVLKPDNIAYNTYLARNYSFNKSI